MSEAAPSTLLEAFNGFVTASMGLHFTPERRDDLRRGIQSAAAEFGFSDVNACIEWLMSAPLGKRQVEILASYLTIGETYFFRDRRSFEVLEEPVLSMLASARRGRQQRLRIWSAGCCSGEEPYSIAMTLAKLFPDLNEWEVTILGTDINPRFLQKAAAGVYTDWSFREAPRIKEAFFTQAGPGRHKIIPEIRKLVQFDYLNLAEDTYPSLLNNTSAMDVIFCRNVLIYLEAEQVKRVIERLARSLAPGGWLFVGAVELSQAGSSELETVSLPGATLYRKRSGALIGSEAPRLFPPVELRFPSRVWEAEIDEAAEKLPEVLPVETLRSVQVTAPPPDPLIEATALYDEGHYVEAIAKLRQLADLESRPAAILLLARAFANLGDLNESLAWCDKAITADKLDPHAYYLQGTILQSRSDLAAAAGSFRRAIYLDDRFVLAHFALGHLLRQAGKPQEGVKHFANALQLLRACPPDDTLPDSEGVTAGRLAEIIARIEGVGATS